MSAATHNPQRGFTLIEVLVSLAIFALGAVALGAGYVNVLVNYQAMRGWTADRNELALVRATLLGEPDRAQAERGGTMTLTGGGTLRWRTDIIEAERTDLFRVTLDCEITPPAPAPGRTERRIFLVLRPTWSEPARRERLLADARERLAQRRFSP